MKVLFRVDASLTLGLRHYYRCLPLAMALRASGADVSFAMSGSPGNMEKELTKEGFQLLSLAPRDFALGFGSDEELDDVNELASLLRERAVKFDWLIIDHFHLGIEWERGIRPWAKKIFVIDDLANRPHECDVLLDPNEFGDKQIRYRSLIPAEAKLLAGPKYALLQSAFAIAREKARPRMAVRDVLVFYGSSDLTNETEKAITALKTFPNLRGTILVGSQNSRKSEYAASVAEAKHIRIEQVDTRLAEQMVNADLMLGSGGAVIWERCAVGLPAIVTLLAENQILASEECEKRGLFRIAGLCSEVTPGTLVNWINHFLRHKELITTFSSKAYDTVDCGGIGRALDVLRNRSNA